MDPRGGPLALAAVVVVVALVALLLAGVASAAGTPSTPVEAPAAAVGAQHVEPGPDRDRYWADEVQRLRALPCGSGSGGTAVYLFVGADEHWSDQLSAALEESRARCRP